MLIDDTTIQITSGNGGDGRVSFNKTKMSLGPTGGSGGRGGNVYLEGISDINALNRLRNIKVFKAQDGQNGKVQLHDGTTGEDLIINIPVGTVIHNQTNNTVEEITKIGERKLVAQGGRGGKGNFHFRGAKKTSPKTFQYGNPGETFKIRLELKLIADVGLVGLPNAGKSSLINELTRANSKVANYPFTTLEPHLGAYYELIIADIPGIIEGASENKGLGLKFLKHVQRTQVLFHLVSAESKSIVTDYRTLRKELGKFSKELLNKKEYLFLSKTDMINAKETKQKLAKLAKLNKNVSPLSIHDLDAIIAVERILNKIKKEKKVDPEILKNKVS
ncbi:MAG: GTPase ObgE [Parcubacteria group bacterium]